ncbi:MAG TPA: sigma-70 family RNA polymerase sigma factor [Thermoanaerobaculia bacterium]|nr:sigma-70 family RNA polymerase sigma factor [Thermoanaerobaculia bacterium]
MTRHRQDLALVARMLRGEEEAFATFTERYLPALYRFTSSRLDGDRELTRDTVQTAMTKALDKLATYRGEAPLSTWLCACCRNEILMTFRSRRTAPEQVELDDAVQPMAGFPALQAADPEAALIGREAAERVHMALDLLPSHYARALEWKYLDRLSVDAIAARLGVRPKAAESLLTRARRAFRACYEDLGVGGRRGRAQERRHG